MLVVSYYFIFEWAIEFTHAKKFIFMYAVKVFRRFYYFVENNSFSTWQVFKNLLLVFIWKGIKTAEYVEFCFNKFFNVCFFIFIYTFSVRRKWLVVIFNCIGKFYLEPMLHSVHLSGLLHQYSIVLYAKHKPLCFLQQRKGQNWTNYVQIMCKSWYQFLSFPQFFVAKLMCIDSQLFHRSRENDELHSYQKEDLLSS